MSSTNILRKRPYDNTVRDGGFLLSSSTDTKKRKKNGLMLVLYTVLLIVSLAGVLGIFKVNQKDTEEETENAGFLKWKKFLVSDKKVPMDDLYITLWLHQVHAWFKGDDSRSKIKLFLDEAKAAGFTSVMTDMPWAWTEREAQNDVRIDTFAKDWLELVCEEGLELHVVISAREFPPWAQTQDDFFELSKCQSGDVQAGSPAIANPIVWQMVQNYIQKTTKLLVDKYGTCVRSISPTLNNEFETRYAQERDIMRDYSKHSVTTYKDWQSEKKIVSKKEEAVDPPIFPIGVICDPLLGNETFNWLGFREEFLAEKYISLCKTVHETVTNVNCLLHFGEFFATTDLLNSNIFFKMAKSEYVNELVMDSNMALLGAPSSPSIVGILVSTALVYDKIVHYEAATERILPCNDDGQLTSSSRLRNDESAGLLLYAGIRNALDAGVHSVGVTNLCKPNEFGKLFANNKVDKELQLYRSESFQPTAVIYVPYRAFHSWSFVLSGIKCGTPSSKCWHTSFDKIPIFGKATHKGKTPGDCPMDFAQHGLNKIWDDLRTRHQIVAVIGDVEKLEDNELVKNAKERVLVSLSCVMEGTSWKFFNGNYAYKKFTKVSEQFPFHEIKINMPGVCNDPDTIAARTK